MSLLPRLHTSSVTVALMAVVLRVAVALMVASSGNDRMVGVVAVLGRHYNLAYQLLCCRYINILGSGWDWYQTSAIAYIKQLYVSLQTIDYRYISETGTILSYPTIWQCSPEEETTKKERKVVQQRVWPLDSGCRYGQLKWVCGMCVPCDFYNCVTPISWAGPVTVCIVGGLETKC